MVAEGVEAIHSAGIIHRDIKPENVTMSLGVAKITDFGWSARTARGLRCFCGTLDYIAPEIIRGDEQDEKVDLWCLGVMAY